MPRPAPTYAPVCGSALVPVYTKRKLSEPWVDGDDSDDSGQAGAFKLARAGGAGKRPGLSPEALPAKRMLSRPRYAAALHGSGAASPLRIASAGNNSSR